jgi:hypothetical protein
MYDLFGADHETSTLEFATGDSDHQFPHELCDQGENDAIRDHHRATALQRSSGTSDYQDKSCYLTTANRGDLAEQRNDLNAAVRYAFSAEDNEITYHGE